MSIFNRGVCNHIYPTLTENECWSFQILYWKFLVRCMICGKFRLRSTKDYFYKGVLIDSKFKKFKDGEKDVMIDALMILNRRELEYGRRTGKYERNDK